MAGNGASGGAPNQHRGNRQTRHRRTRSKDRTRRDNYAAVSRQGGYYTERRCKKTHSPSKGSMGKQSSLNIEHEVSLLRHCPTWTEEDRKLIRGGHNTVYEIRDQYAYNGSDAQYSLSRRCPVLTATSSKSCPYFKWAFSKSLRLFVICL